VYGIAIANGLSSTSFYGSLLSLIPDSPGIDLLQPDEAILSLLSLGDGTL